MNRLKAQQEIKKARPDPALWIKALTLSGGDQEAAKEKYVLLRTAQLSGKTKKYNNSSDLKKENYFIRHFRGDLSLIKSFWINTVAVNILITLLLIVIIPKISLTLHPSLALVFILIDLFTILIWIWQVVGLWRSAMNHISKTGKNFVASLILTGIVFSALSSIISISIVILPQAQEYIKIALGEDMDHYKISILRDGKELEINGGIQFGLTEEVEKYFKEYPNIKIVHLNSMGGRILEAHKLSSFLEEQGIITYTSTGCYSACVDAYMAGDIRLIKRNADLGFHKPYFPGLSEEEINLLIQKNIQFFRLKGVKEEFLKKAYTAEHTDMWLPSHEELIEAGIVTQETDGSQFSATELRRWNNAIELENDLLKLEIYQTIKRISLDTFNDIVYSIHTSLQKGESKAEIFAKTRAIVTKLYAKYLPYTSDKYILKMGKYFVRMQKQIMNKNTSDCHSLIMGNAKVVDLSKYLSLDDLSQELDLMNNVIKTADFSKPIPSEKDIENDLEKIMVLLYVRFGEDTLLLQDLNNPNVDKKKVCQLSIAMFEEILKLPKHKAVRLLRFMFGNIK